MKKAMFAASAACVLMLATHAYGAVVVVDPQPGEFGIDVLRAAVQAAADGDVLLVKAGNYESAVDDVKVLGKGLTLINDSGGVLTLNRLSIVNVPAGSTVVVRGFSVLEATEGKPAVSVYPSAGTVWFEDCVIRGRKADKNPWYTNGPTEGLFVTSCQTVVLERCDVRGGPGLNPTSAGSSLDGAPGATVTSSGIFVYDSYLRGGDPGVGFLPDPYPLAAGLKLTESTALIANSTIEAGPVTKPTGMYGLIAQSHSKVFLRASVVLSTGPAPTILAPPGNKVTTSATPTASIEIGAPIQGGQNVTLDVSGPPGVPVALLLGSFAPAPFEPDPYEGALLVGAPFVGPLVLGTTPASGAFSLNFTTVPLPAGEGATIPLQCVLLTPQPTLEGVTAYVQYY